MFTSAGTSELLPLERAGALQFTTDTPPKPPPRPDRVSQPQHCWYWGPDNSVGLPLVLGMCSSLLHILSPLDARSMPRPQVVTTKNVSRCHQMSSGEQNHPSTSLHTLWEPLARGNQVSTENRRRTIETSVAWSCCSLSYNPSVPSGLPPTPPVSPWAFEHMCPTWTLRQDALLWGIEPVLWFLNCFCLYLSASMTLDSTLPR